MASLLHRAATACAAVLLALPAASQPALVSDIRPGPLTSAPRGFQVMGGDLYFTAARSDVGAEPFRYDAQGVRLATNIIPDPGQGSNPQGPYVPHKGAVYFVAAVQNATGGETGLWRFDGTNTTLVWRGSSPSSLTSYNGDLYFVARHPTAGGGARVWRWDGHDNFLVAGIAQGSFDPEHLTVLGRHLYYTHDTDRTGQKLWRFTAGGTAERVANASFVPASEPSRCGPARFDFVQAYRNALYFTAPDYGLYRFDGTAAPVKLSGGRPRWLGGFGAAVYYTSGTGVTVCGGHVQHTLWGYDSAPRKVATVATFGDHADMGTGVTGATQFIPFRKALYYRSATDVWRFTGSAFERVSDVRLLGNDVPGIAMGPYRGRLYFGLPLGEAYNEELFSYDGHGPVYERIAALGAPAMNESVLDAEADALEAGVVLGGAVAAGDEDRADAAFGLDLASANPSQGPARVRLTLPQGQPARVVVYDALGREVARLHDGPLAAGTHALSWAGDAPAGAYLVRAETGGTVRSVSVVRVR